VSETITLSVIGPHSPEYTEQVANGLAECVRVLNYATGSAAQGAIGYPATVYDVLGSLYTATGRLPQLLGQLAAWLEEQSARGQFRDELDDDALAAVAAARTALGRAGAGLAEVTAALQDAQNAIAGLAAVRASGEDR
jgi:hypothetical protein